VKLDVLRGLAIACLFVGCGSRYILGDLPGGTAESDGGNVIVPLDDASDLGDAFAEEDAFDAASDDALLSDVDGSAADDAASDGGLDAD
jgi:hypothetical protein